MKKIYLLFMILYISLNVISEEKLLIINADDFGQSQSLNTATKELIKDGYITSATLMVPAPWFMDAVEFCKENPEVSVGIHLTLNSEWKGYKWRPVTNDYDVSSLVDEQGYFYDNTDDLHKYAKEEHIRVELTNQIETALRAGIKINHIDNHMFSLDQKGLLKIAIELSKKYEIPFRFSKSMLALYEQWLPDEVKKEKKKYTDKAIREGIPVLDKLLPTSWPMIPGQDYEAYKMEVKYVLDKLVPGVNEILIHPAIESDEIKAINPDSWQKRVWEYRVFKDPDIVNYIKKKNIKLVSWDYLLNQYE